MMGRVRITLLVIVALALTGMARAQGVSPQTGTTIFQGGSFIAYNSIFRGGKGLLLNGTEVADPFNRNVFAHVAPFTFGLSFKSDHQVLITVPVVTRDFNATGLPLQPFTKTGLGDIFLLYKHRFLRIDHYRGTTQVAATVGPKFPTGSTDVRDRNGNLLPPPLQAGSGSTDGFFALAASHVIWKWSLNSSVTYLLRTEGAQDFQFGNLLEWRTFVNYRPYQAPFPGPEWWIGPLVSWELTQRNRINGVRLADSGGNLVFVGVGTLVTLPGGSTILNFAAEFPVVRDLNGSQLSPRVRFSFGVAYQFSFRGS